MEAVTPKHKKRISAQHNAGLIHTRDFSEVHIVQGRIWIQSPNSIWQIEGLPPEIRTAAFPLP